MRKVFATAALVLAIAGMLAFTVTAAYADGNGAQDPRRHGAGRRPER